MAQNENCRQMLRFQRVNHRKIKVDSRLLPVALSVTASVRVVMIMKTSPSAVALYSCSCPWILSFPFFNRLPFESTSVKQIPARKTKKLHQYSKKTQKLHQYSKNMWLFISHSWINNNGLGCWINKKVMCLNIARTQTGHKSPFAHTPTFFSPTIGSTSILKWVADLTEKVTYDGPASHQRERYRKCYWKWDKFWHIW
jgi:hypothetical protein